MAQILTKAADFAIAGTAGAFESTCASHHNVNNKGVLIKLGHLFPEDLNVVSQVGTLK